MGKAARRSLTILLLLVFMAPCASPAGAQAIGYVPLDDRPYSLDRVVEAAEALGVKLLLPPDSFFRGQDGVSDFEGLYEWLASCPKEGAVIVAADAFLFGGLVSSRTNDLDEGEITRRFEALKGLVSLSPGQRFALFGTLLRLPRVSQGVLDADYNAKWAPQLFRLAGLQSAASRGILSADELAVAERLLKTIPPPVLREWANRRNRSLRFANRLLALHSSRGIGFVGIGLDDNVSPILLEQEFRSMAGTIGEIPRGQAAVVPGVDQMGLLLFGRAILEGKPQQRVASLFSLPSVKGGHPNYSGFSPKESLEIQAEVLGVRLVESRDEADMVLVGNLPRDGRSWEASSPMNRPVPDEADRALCRTIEEILDSGKRVAVADIAFDNGADRGFMAALRERKLLDRLAAYSSGNTSDNAIGIALASGVMSKWMSDGQRKWILFARLLDEWGYQAEVRPAVVSKGPFGGQASSTALEADIRERLHAFSSIALSDFGPVEYEVSYPWGRLFEIRITRKE